MGINNVIAEEPAKAMSARLKILWSQRTCLCEALRQAGTKKYPDKRVYGLR